MSRGSKTSLDRGGERTVRGRRPKAGRFSLRKMRSRQEWWGDRGNWGEAWRYLRQSYDKKSLLSLLRFWFLFTGECRRMAVVSTDRGILRFAGDELYGVAVKKGVH